MSQWFVSQASGPPLGPLSTDALVAEVHAGRVPRDAHVAGAGEAAWRPLLEVPELAAALSAWPVAVPGPSTYPPAPYVYPAPQAQPPSKHGWAGIVGIVLGALTLAPLGLATMNIAQAIRMTAEAKLPGWILAAMVEANTRRVILFLAVAGVLTLVGLALSAVGRRSLPGKLAGAFLAVELLGAVGLVAYSTQIPSASGLRMAAAAESDSPAIVRTGTPRAAAATPAPKHSDREIAYTLGTTLGGTVLARSRGLEQDVVDRQMKRADVLAASLSLRLPPLPVLTGDRPKDGVAAIDYLITKDKVGGLVAQVGTTHGEGAAALFELGLKSAIVRMMYLPGDKTSATYAAVFERTGKTAGLKTLEVAAAVKKIKDGGSRDEVNDAIGVMDKAIKAELAADTR